MEKKLVELSLITVAEGEDDTPLEVLPDGTRRPVQTAAAEEEHAPGTTGYDAALAQALTTAIEFGGEGFDLV